MRASASADRGPLRHAPTEPRPRFGRAGFGSRQDWISLPRQPVGRRCDSSRRSPATSTGAFVGAPPRMSCQASSALLRDVTHEVAVLQHGTAAHVSARRGAHRRIDHARQRHAPGSSVASPGGRSTPAHGDWIGLGGAAHQAAWWLAAPPASDRAGIGALAAEVAATWPGRAGRAAVPLHSSPPAAPVAAQQRVHRAPHRSHPGRPVDQATCSAAQRRRPPRIAIAAEAVTLRMFTHGPLQASQTGAHRLFASQPSGRRCRRRHRHVHASALRAPQAMASTTGSLTAPCAWMTSAGTPSISVLAALLLGDNPDRTSRSTLNGGCGPRRSGRRCSFRQWPYASRGAPVRAPGRRRARQCRRRSCQGPQAISTPGARRRHQVVKQGCRSPCRQPMELTRPRLEGPVGPNHRARLVAASNAEQRKRRQLRPEPRGRQPPQHQPGREHRPGRGARVGDAQVLRASTHQPPVA